MITEKYIFECKLKGEPVRIMKGETTPEEAKILVNAGIMKIDREAHGVNVAIALYPVVGCGMIKASGHEPYYREMYIEPGKFLHY